MNIQFETYDASKRHDQAVAHFGAWSALSGTMLALSRQRVQNYPLSLLGFAPDSDLPLTHAAITVVEDSVATIGGYVTNPNYVKQGLGQATLTQLVTAAPDVLDGVESYQAYVNQAGLSQFAALGDLQVSPRPPETYQPGVPLTGCDYLVQFVPVAVAPALQEMAV